MTLPAFCRAIEWQVIPVALALGVFGVAVCAIWHRVRQLHRKVNAFKERDPDAYNPCVEEPWD